MRSFKPQASQCYLTLISLIIIVLSLLQCCQNKYITQISMQNIVSNKAISIAPPEIFNDNPQFVYYQLLSNKIIIYQINSATNKLKFDPIDNKTVLYIQWLTDGILIAGRNWMQIVDPTNAASLHYATFDNNRTLNGPLVVSLTKNLVAFNLGDCIQIYSKTQLVHTFQLQNQQGGFSSMNFIVADRFFNYFQYTNTTQMQTRKVVDLDNQDIIVTQQGFPKFITSQSSPKNDLIFAVGEGQTGIRAFTSDKMIQQKFPRTTEYDMLGFLSEDILVGATFKGLIHFWKVDYANLTKSQIIQEIDNIGQSNSVERIIYITSRNQNLIVYTEQFHIYIINESNALSNVIFYVVIGVAVLTIIGIIIFCVIWKKNGKKQQTFQFENQKQNPPTQPNPNSLHDYLKSNQN